MIKITWYIKTLQICSQTCFYIIGRRKDKGICAFRPLDPSAIKAQSFALKISDDMRSVHFFVQKAKIHIIFVVFIAPNLYKNRHYVTNYCNFNKLEKIVEKIDANL